MTELLVCVRGHGGVRSPQFGDVIHAAEDGHRWSWPEITNPDWTVLKAPHLSMADVAHLLTSEIANDPTNLGRALQYRGFFVDALKPTMPRELSEFLCGIKRGMPYFTLSPSLSLEDIVSRRAPVVDPLILGSQTPNVIG